MGRGSDLIMDKHIHTEKDLNMKEIAFIGQTITEVAVKRGCYNNCSHCYAGGMPPIREDSEHINKMSWNDFTALTDGFKELNKRLGFSITKSHKKAVIRLLKIDIYQEMGVKG